MSVIGVIRAITLLAVLSTRAVAHQGELIQPHDLWTAWSFDWGIILPLVLTAGLYARGARHARGFRRWEVACFWLGWVSLALALVSPLHPLGEVLFSAHMVQHEVIMTVSAPLLVMGSPVVAFLWAFPISWRRSLGKATRSTPVQRTWSVLTGALLAWLIHGVVLWAWHIPALFDRTLGSDLIHSLQHLSFLGAALLYWWSLVRAHSGRTFGASVLSLFTTAIHTVLLGALLTLAPQPLYSGYATRTAAWGLTHLEDQQLAGLIMWIPAGIVYVGAGLALLYLWLKASDPGVRDGVDGRMLQPSRGEA
jgi:putative membrane protein